MEIEGVKIAPLISWETLFIGFIIVLIAVRLGAELIVYLNEKKARKTRQRQTGGNVPPSASKAVQRYYNTYRKGA